MVRIVGFGSLKTCFQTLVLLTSCVSLGKLLHLIFLFLNCKMGAFPTVL